MNWFKRNNEIIFSSIGFLVILSYYICIGMDDKIFLGLLGIIATLYFGALKYNIDNDKVFKDLFKEFNSKYDYKLNDLLNELKDDENRILSSKEKNLVIDYLNLCSEEYLWRRRRRIPKIVWEAWKSGIKLNLGIKQVKQIYNQEISTMDGRNSFYGLFEELEK